uniref:Uncharacterized protein n=1 Tax=Rhizophora mucronata TaxID=61149 RepID=A0A2P2Q1L8_RHIMU
MAFISCNHLGEIMHYIMHFTNGDSLIIIIFEILKE